MKPGNLNNHVGLIPKSLRRKSLQKKIKIFGSFGQTEDPGFKQRIRNHYCPGPAWQPTDPCYLDLATNQAQADEILSKRRSVGCTNDQMYCYGFDNVPELLIPTPVQAPAPPQEPVIKAPAPIQTAPALAPTPAVSRPALSIPYTGSCPRTHYKATDAMGDFCHPCSPGQLFYEGACKPKPPVCPCNLKRTGDPDFGQCPPAPTACGPAPQSQQCNVPGWGIINTVCKCGIWQCPTAKDMLIAKFKREGKPIPPDLAGNGFSGGINKSFIWLVVIGIIAIYLMR